MGYGLRSAVRLAATVAAAAVVARAAESARRFFEQAALQGHPEQRALPSASLAPSSIQAVPDGSVVTAQPAAHHPFGPTPSVVPAHGIGFRATAPPPRAQAPAARPARAMQEPTPIDKLRARRNADRPTRVSVPGEEPAPDERTTESRPQGRHRRDVAVDSSSTVRSDTEFTLTIPMGQSPINLRLAPGPQNTLTLTVSLPGATVDDPL